MQHRDEGAGSSASSPTPDELWRRHEFLNGLYRFYVERIISFHSFYLPIAGGVVAYVLTHTSRPAAFGLFIPLVVSMGAVWIFGYAVREADELNDAIRKNAMSLGILATHAQLLVRAVAAFLVLHILIVLALGAGFAMLLVYGTLPGLPVPCDSGQYHYIERRAGGIVPLVYPASPDSSSARGGGTSSDGVRRCAFPPYEGLLS